MPMKRLLISLSLSLFLMINGAVQADEILDNSLQFDSKRLEKTEDQKQGDQSQLIAPLFSQSDLQRLVALNKQKSEQFASEQGQLFSHAQTLATIYHEDILFSPDPNQSLLGKGKKTEEKVNFELFNHSLLYGGASLLVILLASVASYHVFRKDEKDGSY